MSFLQGLFCTRDIWQPSYQSGEPDRVLGYEVHTSAYAPKDAISFGDYKYYNGVFNKTQEMGERRIIH